MAPLSAQLSQHVRHAFINAVCAVLLLCIGILTSLVLFFAGMGFGWWLFFQPERKVDLPDYYTNAVLVDANYANVHRAGI